MYKVIDEYFICDNAIKCDDNNLILRCGIVELQFTQALGYLQHLKGKYINEFILKFSKITY